MLFPKVLRWPGWVHVLCTCAGLCGSVEALDSADIRSNFTIAGWVTPQARIHISTPTVKGISAMSGQLFVVEPDAGHERYGTAHSAAGISVGVNGIMVVEHSEFYYSPVLAWEEPLNRRIHLAVVYREGVPELFVDGKSVMLGIASGRTVHPGTLQNDAADEWAVYAEALSVDQIEGLCPERKERVVRWADGSASETSGDTRDASATYRDVFASAFQNPPDSTRPSVYWYWMRNNLSREGITKDLEAMQRVGIGSAFIGNIGPTMEGRGSVEMFSEQWWELTDHAIREGTRLGVDIGMFNCPGWSQTGGPWVKAEDSMRYLNFSRVSVSGPGPFSQKLEAPSDIFQDVAVLAFPEQPDPARDALRSAKVTTAPMAQGTRMIDGDLQTGCQFPAGAGKKAPFEVLIQYPEAVTVQSVSITPEKVPLITNCELQGRDASGNYQLIRKFTIDRRGHHHRGPMRYGPVTEVFEPVTAREFRLIFTALATPSKSARIAEIELSGVQKTGRYIEKQLGQMFQSFHAPWGAFVWEPAPEEKAFLQANQILNLSEHMDRDGNLLWDAPSGAWTVLRLGMSPTHARNDSAPPEAQGMEIDKMSRKRVEDFFPLYLGEMLARLTPEERASWKYVIFDSYEKGSQNWTDNLQEAFEDRYGYDPLPWLPVVAGAVIDTPDRSDRFLWDLRRLVADKFADEYAGAFREICHENGLKLWVENYGHFGFPGESLQYGGRADIPAGEFWTGGPLGSSEPRIAASSGHIYGKPVIAAESFTSGRPAWLHVPWTIKQCGDWVTAEGVNQFVLHVYIHQPDDRSPGINAWFGTEFNRNNTWFDYMDGWISSLRRTHAVLQEGQHVADLLYFTGEDAPKETGVLEPPLPEGYNFDFINGEVIHTRLQVRNGRFVLPDGTSYALLVLPPLDTMRPEMLDRIAQLVEQGGAVLGNPPSRSPSMANYPDCDEQVRSIAARLWRGINGEDVTAGRYGEGFVFRGVGPDAALTALGVGPDIRGIGNRPSIGSREGLTWIHRRTVGEDAYFLANQGDETLSITPAFRVSGRKPELWDSVSGEMRPLPQFTEQEGYVQVPLEFGPRESWMLVFRDSAESAACVASENFPSYDLIMTLCADWDVRFDPALKGPGAMQFEKLVDWTEHPEEGIKYYSGTASYQTTFRLESLPEEPLFLNLGKYESIARVRLNGEELGVVWMHPGRIEISAAVRLGENHLEVDIANTWSNRVLGDRKLPEAERITWTSLDHGMKPDAKLMPSGLLGPVQIEYRK